MCLWLRYIDQLIIKKYNRWRDVINCVSFFMLDEIIIKYVKRLFGVGMYDAWF